MAKKDDADGFAGWLAKLMLFAVAWLFGAIAVYFWNFHQEGLSRDQGHWGQFGDFLGGVVNPVFGFLTLVVLMITLQIQRRMLAESRAQDVLEELQRFMAATSSSLDAYLDARASDHMLLGVEDSALGARGLIGQASVRDVVRSLSRQMLACELDIGVVASLAKSKQLEEVFRVLIRLDLCITEFLSRNGNPVIGKLYGSQYGEAATLLHGLDAMAVFVSGHLDYPKEALVRLGLGSRIKELDACVVKHHSDHKRYWDEHAVRQAELEQRIEEDAP